MKCTIHIPQLIGFVYCRKAPIVTMLVVLAVVSVFATSQLSADEGRKPIYQPTTITQPGNYILTRNISIATDMNAISVYASNVTIDLDGKSLNSTSTVYAVIEVYDGYTNVTIKNGYINGGGWGIHYSSASIRTKIFLENLAISNTSYGGIDIYRAEYVNIISCKILTSAGYGIDISGMSDSCTGKIINNTINGAATYGIYLDGFRAGEVRGNNVIKHGTAMTGAGIYLTGILGGDAAGTLVEGNTISTGQGNNLAIDIDSGSNLILNNTMTMSGWGIGISNNANNNVIRGNIITSNSKGGIDVYGNVNFIEDNQISSNGSGGVGYGIYFESAGANAYRNNMIHANAQGAVGGGANTDGGGNIL